MEAAQGLAKIVSAKDDDEVLGVHVIGPMAGELISEAVLAMEYSASTEDIQRTIHAHPDAVRGHPRGRAGGGQEGDRQHQPLGSRDTSCFCCAMAKVISTCISMPRASIRESKIRN